MLSRPDELLSHWTTLRLGGSATRFREAPTRDALYDAVAGADAADEPVLVLGGGSNLVIADSGFDGTVIRVDTSGVAIEADTSSGAAVTVDAGESWDAFVARAVKEEWAGVEALAGIPGTVGAVPIQNVGAYGQEVSETISHVNVYDRLERRTLTLLNAACGFGYRTSMFKQHPGRYVVGSVTFRFHPDSLGAPVMYAELARAVGVDPGGRVPAAQVREAVLALRRSKGMVLDPDDHDTWSAGSFFTNPFIETAAVPDGAPAFPQGGGRVKTSAAWLIERAGFGKGYGNERVSLSTKHTLALTNRGTATTADLLTLAAEIHTGVKERFGIDLQAEPVLVGCAI